MDKEIKDKHYRFVGSLQALEVLAKQISCMPSDAATAAMLDAIRHLAQRAVVSAWEYADRQTAPSAGDAP